MSKTIYKYTIYPDILFYSLPENAKILTVNEQSDDICIWAKVDSEQIRMELRKIMVFGTGHVIPDEPMKYIGTVCLQHGALVFHVYEGRYNTGVNDE